MCARVISAFLLVLVVTGAQPVRAAGAGRAGGSASTGVSLEPERLPIRTAEATVQNERRVLPAEGETPSSTEPQPSTAEPSPEKAAVPAAREWALWVTPQLWVSRGQSVFSIGGTGGVPNILSELEWNDVDSAMVGLELEGLLARRWLVRASGFVGVVQSGTFVDSDYLTNNRTNLFSQSTGQLDDTALWSVSFDVGYRLLSWEGMARNSQATLDVLIGMQSWREEYRSIMGVQTQDPFGLIGFTGPFPNQGPGVQETFTYNSLRVGFRQRLPVHRYVVIEGEFLFLPWTQFNFTDEHFQRPDLASPAVEVTTTGGLGYQWHAGVRFPLTPQWSLQAMYAMWSVEAGGGDVTLFRSDGTQSIQPLYEGSTTRQGVMFQTSWQF